MTPKTSPAPHQDKAQVDAIIEAVIYLYTESRRLTKEIAARYGLTGPQLTVVKILEAVGDLSLSSLSSRIQARNSTVTGIVDRMEREELVVRARSEKDRRVVHIRLTDKGSSLARDVPVEPMVIFRQALAILSPEETHALLSILTKLAEQVRQLVRDNDQKSGGKSPGRGSKNSGGERAS